MIYLSLSVLSTKDVDCSGGTGGKELFVWYQGVGCVGDVGLRPRVITIVC